MHGLNGNPAQVVSLGDAERPTAAKAPKRTMLATTLTAALWLAFVIGGAVLLNLHATTPGKQGEAPARWPVASRVIRSASDFTLLVFLHPYCPCSRTTLGELAEIMATSGDKVTAQVVFVTAGDDQPDWPQNELWQVAKGIPGVHALVDSNGIEATRFGARTSGLAVLFGKQGECLFSGGITASRGHAGDNAGRQAILSCLAEGRPEASRTPTFGCALFQEAPSANSEDRR